MRAIFRRCAIAALAGALALQATLAAAQTTNPTQVNTEGTRPTYSASSVALAAVTGATDFFCISPTTKTIRVLRLQASATASAIVTIDLSLVLRSTLTVQGGATIATSTANPANTVTAHNLNDPATTATLVAYTTANPTPGVTAGIIRTQKIVANIAVQAVGTVPPIIWDFTTRNGRGVVLQASSTRQLCLNLNAGAIGTSSFDIDIEYSEE